MTFHEQRDTELIAGLHRDIDKAHREAGAAKARVIELERLIIDLKADVADLQARIVGIAEEAERENEPHEKRGSGFWFGVWREVKREKAEQTLRITQLEGWLKEYGAELAKLQTRCTLLQAIADAVRSSDPAEAIGTIHVRHPNSGAATPLFRAIDHASKGSPQ